MQTTTTTTPQPHENTSKTLRGHKISDTGELINLTPPRAAAPSPSSNRIAFSSAFANKWLFPLLNNIHGVAVEQHLSNHQYCMFYELIIKVKKKTLAIPNQYQRQRRNLILPL
jgi:hypothetical protein